MTLQQMNDFVAVVQHGSLHAAARATGQAQSALSKSLRRLEESMGTPLFVRHARGVQDGSLWCRCCGLLSLCQPYE